MKTRRVGAVTCGIILVVVGILCLIHIFYPAFRYEYILRGWPLILILIGAEILVANTTCAENVEMKYDIPAVILVFVLVAFAMMMGCMEFVVEHYGWY